MLKNSNNWFRVLLIRPDSKFPDVYLKIPILII